MADATTHRSASRIGPSRTGFSATNIDAKTHRPALGDSGKQIAQREALALQKTKIVMLREGA
jgi:hypothetical protein